MIIVTLMGGMGNQMFQYSLAKSLSIKNNIPFKIDLSFLKNRNMGSDFVYRDYDLDIFNISPDFDINKSDVEGLINLKEPTYHYCEEIMDFVQQHSNENIRIEGYWQTPKYFRGIEDEIRKDFLFIEPIEKNKDTNIISMLDDILSSNSIMINVRRTDYLNTNFHGVMGNDYITNACKLIESKVDNPKYFIFSDDIDWCIDNIKLDNMVIVDHTYKGNKFGTYLQLMKSCKNFIIPNSSFAWWAAWLNEDYNKIVIAPKMWFTDSNIDTSDLIPSNWIRI